MDVVRAAFERLAQGDFSDFADLPDEFELVLAPELPDAGTYRGEEARRWILTWVDAFERLTEEPAAVTHLGDNRLLVEFIQRGWRAGSDVPVEVPTWSISTLRDRTLVRVQLFGNRPAALEAAGLSE